jgi:hypothetical protein
MSGEESHNNNNNHGEGPSNKRVRDQMTMQEKKQLKIEAKAKAEHHMQVQHMFSYIIANPVTLTRKEFKYVRQAVRRAYPEASGQYEGFSFGAE